MARTIKMHTDLQISSCWEHILLETCMNSLVKVPPYSKLNFPGKIDLNQISKTLDNAGKAIQP
jgi:hypothetical protein